MSYTWIARRARRIETFYGLYAGRRMAIQLAIEDWHLFKATGHGLPRYPY